MTPMRVTTPAAAMDHLPTDTTPGAALGARCGAWALAMGARVGARAQAGTTREQSAWAPRTRVAPALPHQDPIDSEGVQGSRLSVQSLRHGRGQTQGDRAARRPAVIACDVMYNEGQSVFIKAG